MSCRKGIDGIRNSNNSSCPYRAGAFFMRSLEGQSAACAGCFSGRLFAAHEPRRTAPFHRHKEQLRMRADKPREFFGQFEIRWEMSVEGTDRSDPCPTLFIRCFLEFVGSSCLPKAQPEFGRHFLGFSYHTTFLLNCPAINRSRSPSRSISTARIS